MKSKVEDLEKWIGLYQRSYFIAEEKQISQILLQLISQLEKIMDILLLQTSEAAIMKIFTELLAAMEQKDYVKINDLIETTINPLIKQNQS